MRGKALFGTLFKSVSALNPRNLSATSQSSALNAKPRIDGKKHAPRQGLYLNVKPKGDALNAESQGDIRPRFKHAGFNSKPIHAAAKSKNDGVECPSPRDLAYNVSVTAQRLVEKGGDAMAPIQFIRNRLLQYPHLQSSLTLHNQIIAMAGRSGLFAVAFDQFERMKQLKLKPDARTHASLLNGLAEEIERKLNAKQAISTDEVMRQAISIYEDSSMDNGYLLNGLLKVAGLLPDTLPFVRAVLETPSSPQTLDAPGKTLLFQLLAKQAKRWTDLQPWWSSTVQPIDLPLAMAMLNAARTVIRNQVQLTQRKAWSQYCRAVFEACVQTELKPRVPLCSLMAEIYLRLQQYQAGIEFIQQYALTNPNHLDEYLLGMVIKLLAGGGKFELAREAFTKWQGSRRTPASLHLLNAMLRAIAQAKGPVSEATTLYKRNFMGGRLQANEETVRWMRLIMKRDHDLSRKRTILEHLQQLK